MKRFIASIVASVFALGLGVALLSAPAVAVGHPGNTCNPAAGHGVSGCHRVTAPSGAATAQTRARATAQATAQKAAAQKAAAQKRAAAASAAAAAAKKSAAAKRAAAAVSPAPPAAVATVPTAPSVPATAAAPLVSPHPAAPSLPWWLRVWHFLFG